MNKKELQIALSKLKTPTRIKRRLEQYFTPCDVASDVAWTIALTEGIEDKVVADFGSGVGTLGIAMALLGAKKVYLIEKDPDLYEYLKANVAMFSLRNVEIVMDDVFNFHKTVDLVVQNPPFGIEHPNKTIDIAFIKHGLDLAEVVYSIHHLGKATEKKFSKYLKDHRIERIKVYDFMVKRVLPTHKKPVHRFKVALYRITRS